MKKILLALILSTSCIIVNAQPGHLDSTFGINGLVRTVVGMNYPASVGKDVLLHPDGSFYIFLSLSGFNGFCNVAHFMANGTLDLSYGEEGYSAHIPIIVSMESRAVIQPDGKIIIGAYVNNNGNQDFLLVRLTTSGFLDSSFSNDGKQVTDINSTDNSVSALALQNDGKILALGGGMARYHPDGSLDSSFSGDGKLAGADGTSIAIQSDGKILTAGNGPVFRYLADGTLDIGFGLGGSVSFSFISPVVIKAVAVQNDVGDAAVVQQESVLLVGTE